jgi:hypothetical protein
MEEPADYAPSKPNTGAIIKEMMTSELDEINKIAANQGKVFILKMMVSIGIWWQGLVCNLRAYWKMEEGFCDDTTA